MAPTPNPIDLTTLASFKARMNVKSTNDDTLIAYLITSASLFALHECGLGPMDWSLPNPSGPNVSPLAAPCQFHEFYDGNGSIRMFLRNRPIVSVASLIINGVTMTQSLSYGNPGFVIDAEGKSIALRGAGKGTGTFSFSGWPSPGAGFYFAKGIQNVEILYTAGYASVPPDLQDKIETLVGVTYRQAQKREQASIAMAQGAGTIAFRDWDIPPEVLRTIHSYRRTAIV